MSPSIFNSVANWVLQHQQLGISSAATESDVAQALESLYASASKCTACVMIPGLFPGSTLETVYMPTHVSRETAVQSQELPPKGGEISPLALETIGSALSAHLKQSENDLVHYQFDNGAQAAVYIPEERNTVLQALGLTLLEA